MFERVTSQLYAPVEVEVNCGVGVERDDRNTDLVFSDRKEINDVRNELELLDEVGKPDAVGGIEDE